MAEQQHHSFTLFKVRPRSYRGTVHRRAFPPTHLGGHPCACQMRGSPAREARRASPFAPGNAPYHFGRISLRDLEDAAHRRFLACTYRHWRHLSPACPILPLLPHVGRMRVCVQVLRAHILPLTNCAFNKSGDRFITGSYDRTCKVRPTRMRACIHACMHGRANACMGARMRAPLQRSQRARLAARGTRSAPTSWCPVHAHAWGGTAAPSRLRGTPACRQRAPAPPHRAAANARTHAPTHIPPARLRARQQPTAVRLGPRAPAACKLAPTHACHSSGMQAAPMPCHEMQARIAADGRHVMRCRLGSQLIVPCCAAGAPCPPTHAGSRAQPCVKRSNFRPVPD